MSAGAGERDLDLSGSNPSFNRAPGSNPGDVGAASGSAGSGQGGWLPPGTLSCVPGDCIVMAHDRGEGPRWLTSCLCGFLVTDFGTVESAEDTRLWHLGLPSLLGSVQ